MCAGTCRAGGVALWKAWGEVCENFISRTLSCTTITPMCGKGGGAAQGGTEWGAEEGRRKPLNDALIPEPVPRVAPKRAADGDRTAQGLTCGRGRETREGAAPLNVCGEATVAGALPRGLEPRGDRLVHPRHRVDPRKRCSAAATA